MANDGTVKIGTELDSAGLDKGMQGLSGVVKKGLGGIAILSKVAVKGITAVSGALAAGGAMGVKYNSEIEQYQTAFEVMTGSAEKAIEVTEKLKQIGASTPFELPDLAETTKLLMNYGFTADDAIGRMQMLGDISQGSADKMQRVATAYGQMSSAGKVSLEDVKQMIEAGFNPLQEISESTGESMASLYERISKGTISVDEITASMQRATSEGGKYYQSMEKQSQTLSGRLSTLKDNAKSLLGEVVQPISNSMVNVLLPDAIETIEKMTEAYEKKGLKGLVETAGTAFADIAADAAKQAPKLVSVAVEFIKAFVEGIKKNKKKLIEAAGEIVKAFAGGLAELLPKSVQAPVKKAISEIEKSLTSGGLKKGITTVADLFKDVIKVVSELAGKILPPAVKIIDALAGNLDILIPLLIGTVAAMKTFTVIQTVTGTVGKLTTAVKGFLAALAANPMTAVIALAAGAAAGLAALVLTLDGTTDADRRLAAAQESLGETFGTVGAAAASFSDGIKDAGSIFDNFNDSVLVSNEAQQELADRMDSVQSEITEIARTASDERRQLTESEISRLQELFEEMKNLSQQELALHQARQTAVQNAATALVDSKVEEASAYEEQAQTIINSAQQERDSIIDAAYNQMIEKNAINQQLLGTSAEYNEAWLAQQEQASQAEYQAAIDSANKQCADTLSVIQDGYYDQFVARNDALEKFTKANQDVTDENTRHNEEMLALQKQADDLLKSEYDDAVYKRKDVLDEMERKEEEHKNKVAGIWSGVSGEMSTAEQNQVGSWLAMVAHTELYGGKISQEASDQVDDFLAAYEQMPEGTRESMRNAMAPMLQEMQNSEPTLYSKAEGIAGGILSRLNKAFDVHSPSRKTRKIFKRVMEGAEVGIDKEKKNLFGRVDKVSTGVLDRLQGIDVGGTMSRISAAMQARQKSTGMAVSAQSEYRTKNSGSEQNRQSQTQQIDYDKLASANAKALEGMTVACDEREFGRVVRKVVPV